MEEINLLMEEQSKDANVRSQAKAQHLEKEGQGKRARDDALNGMVSVGDEEGTPQHKKQK